MSLLETQEIMPIATEELVQRIKAATDEQKMIAIQCMPSELLWNELHSRFFEDQDDLTKIINAVRDAKLYPSICTPTNG